MWPFFASVLVLAVYNFILNALRNGKDLGDDLP